MRSFEAVKTRNFVPKPQRKEERVMYLPPILKPTNDRELNLLTHVRDWHVSRSDMKEDGKRHRIIANAIALVIGNYHG